MSDFLSNFSNGKYQPEAAKDPLENGATSQVSDTDQDKVIPDEVPQKQGNPDEMPCAKPNQTRSEGGMKNDRGITKSFDSRTDKNEKLVDQIQEPSTSQPVLKDSLLVKDQLFAKKRQMKRFIIGGASCLVVASICLFYYKQTHVTLPDFTNKPVSKAQSWADDNQVKLEIDRVYKLDKKVNTIIKQADKNKSIAKKKGTKLIVSLGADPKVKIKLPDFSTRSVDQARDFIKKNKLENTVIEMGYSDTVAKGGYLKQVFANASLTSDNFKREDNLTLHYSKGKEPITKNIVVPDFSSQTKDQINSWSKDKGVKVEIQEEASNTIEVGKVISQSVGKLEKISKADTIIIKLSAGKPILVPDYAKFTFEEASGAPKELPVLAKQVYSDRVPYGDFIGQSVAAGTQYFIKDTIPDITATYSLGRVYMKDLSGQTEGDLQSAFHNDYTSKGANITYQIQYINSSETKGTVVAQSVLNEFVPLTFTVAIGISTGNE
ncbi:PASTA domain-containing protein [Lactococcus paracarnosus]|uniref:PASTA domain-containing protein n=1 Tax=Pseudolactococcus paracarnosus TaxID=2749962 RepID=A0ABT0AMV7_9LACT|nr:PASTA domain-containing protein [Lactococcus paracarnosus]MCJ1977853.1 PASTA domain-containing protein [Lactococcus paracarnosus]MCJ1984002.1 PASTA domain-containing protein [Lactococcus paracarnosus]MCJ1998148.1 PASTA domain-containing protein [Lactococcus paracarnosus]